MGGGGATLDYTILTGMSCWFYRHLTLQKPMKIDWRIKNLRRLQKFGGGAAAAVQYVSKIYDDDYMKANVLPEARLC